MLRPRLKAYPIERERERESGKEREREREWERERERERDLGLIRPPKQAQSLSQAYSLEGNIRPKYVRREGTPYNPS